MFAQTEVDRYLQSDKSYLQRLVFLNAALEDSLSDHCLLTVVIPAKNEEGFLTRTLTSLVSQDLPAEEFETILVLNDCVDRTSDVAESFGQEHRDFRIHILNCQMTEECRGVGYARKLGFDLALLRAHVRGTTHTQKPDLSSFYLYSTDADTILPPDHLRTVVGTFILLEVDALAGCINFPQEFWQIRPLACQLNSLLLDVEKEIGERFGYFLCGANFGITASMYATVGGLPPKFTGSDYALGLRVVRQGGRIGCLRNPVTTSCRRWRADICAMFSLEAYQANTFASTDVHQSSLFEPEDISRNQFWHLLNRRLDIYAKDVTYRSDYSLAEAKQTVGEILQVVIKTAYPQLLSEIQRPEYSVPM